MSDDKHEYSDELLGLLGEFSGKELEQVKTIFSPEARRAQRRFLEPGGKISEHAASLSSLEREMLAVHRAELGQLMQDACLRLFLEHETLGPYVLASTPRDLKLKPDTPRAWRDRTQRVRSIYPDPEGMVEPLEIMSALMTDGERQPDLLEVAQAGLRIAPSVALRSYSALGYMGRNDLPSSEKLLQDMLGAYISAETRQKVACGMGRIASLRKDHIEEVKWSRMAAVGPEPIPTSALCYLVHSVQLGDHRMAVEASSLISETLPVAGSASNAVLDRYCRILSTDRLTGSWRPTPGAIRFLASPPHGLSDHAQRIIDVFR